MKYIFYSFIKFLNIRLAHCIRLMYQRIHENSKSEWAIRDNDDAPKDAIGQLPPPRCQSRCDDTMKIVITRTGATIIAAFTIAICHRLGTVWDYSTNHLVTFNYQTERGGAEFRAL